MRYRRMINGDYSFGNSQADFITGTLAVAQAIKTNLLLLYGEWWEETDKGLPLFQNILGQPGTPESRQAADLVTQACILGTPGVISLRSFNSSVENKTYSVECVAETPFGDATVEVTF